jgi:multiple antibiotic resistance protein
MEIILNEIGNFSLMLLTILNPIGALSVFITITQERTHQDIRQISKYCAITIGLTLLISLLMGTKILLFFGISISSFRIGGGLLLFTMAFAMISGKNPASKLTSEEIDNIQGPEEIGIVPLAIPLIAGPGTISTCIIHSSELTNWELWTGALVTVLIMSLFILFILRNSRKIALKLGNIGLGVMSRIMGLILLAISVEMITQGLKTTFFS